MYFSKAVFSFFLTILFLLLALKLFPKFGFMDNPKKWGFKRDPIPYSVGIVVVFSFIISVLIFVPIDFTLLLVLISALFLSVVGFIDDKIHLSPFLRLLCQIFASVLLVFSGIKLLSFKLPFIGIIPLDMFEVFGVYLLSAFFLIFWTVLLVNAMNFLDGVPGLNSVVTAIASFTIFLLSIHSGIHEDPSSQYITSILALILGSSALALLFFDFPKPHLLMGDSGSTFFGFMLAVLSVISGGKIATAFLVLGIPLIDLVWVVVRRTIEGKKFWQGDLKHLHHRFLNYGFSEKQVVLIYASISLVFGFFAVVFVDSSQKFFTIIALILLISLLAYMLVFGKGFLKK